MKRISTLLSVVFLYSSLSHADVTINIVDTGLNVKDRLHFASKDFCLHGERNEKI